MTWMIINIQKKKYVFVIHKHQTESNEPTDIMRAGCRSNNKLKLTEKQVKNKVTVPGESTKRGQ